MLLDYRSRYVFLSFSIQYLEEVMTPAINLLQKKGINFDVLSYQHDPSKQQFGLEAVEKLKLPAEQVFKTLVLEDTEHQLSLIHI